MRKVPTPWREATATLGAVQGELSQRWFRIGVSAATVAVATFLLVQLHAWPPHEDETLALFVADKPLGTMFDVVLGQRGGAPLHFLLVHLVAAISPTLTALRLVSVLFAVASIPVIALLVARLSGRRTALVATVLVAASWVLLFHGIYGRMYSLFLFLSALSLLALLHAIEHNRRLVWALWGLVTLAMIASHQYGAFVLAIEAAYLLIMRLRGAARLLPAAVAFGVVVIAAVPVWRSTLVLASRLEVGVGGDRGTQLGGPIPVLEYLRSSLGDFVAGWTFMFAIVAAIACFGLAVLARSRPPAAILTGLVFAVPTVGLMLAHAGGSASAPETRHLIFALPFFAMLVAAGLERIARAAGDRAATVLTFGLATLVAVEIAWGWNTTPTLFAGEPPRRTEARQAAETWLARTSRLDDVYFGYDPLYLGARERGGAVGQTVIPRADPKLALDALLEVRGPLGRGVWVLDTSDGSRTVSNWSLRLKFPGDPAPGPEFETKVFGPFLVVRTIEPTGTAGAFLRDTMAVQRTQLVPSPEPYWRLPNAEINDATARVALSRLAAQS
jgi:Dolichyl-phosphate-mannose-protein mannosyltransferase